MEQYWTQEPHHSQRGLWQKSSLSRSDLRKKK
jgi:hypothetical protein